MRSEKEMRDLILGIAGADARIRAVVLNGSRADPKAPKDIFQDFDIVYIVTEMEPFLADQGWVDAFGARTIMQLPDLMGEPPPRGNGSFGYLMQFLDGNRIDLSLCPLALAPRMVEDSLSVLLLDKDGIFGALPPPTDEDYLPKPPTPKAYADCCNEFWWVSLYVAKGLWREELPYAKRMQEIVRDELDRMLAWLVGTETEFREGTGKMGKHLERRLPPELWAMYERSYADADYENSWLALLESCKLFRLAALRVGRRLGLEYPRGDDERASAHLLRIRSLPKDAKDM
jgi:aminoglycoside 6-adenylyltransferase